jgi:hypothetical protein
MVSCDGAGASHELARELDRFASRRGYQVTWSVGWTLGAREQHALGMVPGTAWEAAVDGKGQVRERRADGACQDPRCAHPACWIEEARHQADRAAARGGRRQPAERLAENHAGLRPLRAAPPRRSAVAVRDRRRLALLAVGDEPAR